MKEFIFEGHSDDTFGEINVTRDDYDNCASGTPIRYTLTDGDKGLLIVGIYCNDINEGDGWLIGVSNLNEGKPADWEVFINPCHGCYKNQVRILAPDEAELTCLNRRDRDQ